MIRATLLGCLFLVQPISAVHSWQDEFFPGFNPLPIPAYADRPVFIPNQPLSEHHEELVKRA
jgi:hypothetical protein